MSIRFTPVLLEDSITRSYHHFFTYENELFIFGGARIVWYGTDPQISYSLFKFVNKKWRTLKVGLIHHNTIIRGLTLINGNLCCLFDTQLYKIDLKNLKITIITLNTFYDTLYQDQLIRFYYYKYGTRHMKITMTKHDDLSSSKKMKFYFKKRKTKEFYNISLETFLIHNGNFIAQTRVYNDQENKRNIRLILKNYIHSVVKLNKNAPSRIMYFKNESIDYMIPYQKDIFIFGRKSGIFTVWKLDSHLFIRTQVEFQGCKPILNIKGYAIAVNENVILMHGGHIRENVRSEMFQLKIEQDYYSRLFSKLKSEAFVDVEIKMRTRKRKRSEI